MIKEIIVNDNNTINSIETYELSSFLTSYFTIILSTISAIESNTKRLNIPIKLYLNKVIKLDIVAKLLKNQKRMPIVIGHYNNIDLLCTLDAIRRNSLVYHFCNGKYLGGKYI